MKLTEKQLKEARRRALERTAKDVLYMGKIRPNADNPRTVAKYLVQELFDCPPRGARAVGRLIELRWNEQRFIGRMLTALGEYLLKGQPMFDSVDVDAANIKRLQPSITVSEIVSKLEKLHPSFTRDALEKRVRRLLDPIPREYI
jgi:hypothetical protein